MSYSKLVCCGGITTLIGILCLLIFGIFVARPYLEYEGFIATTCTVVKLKTPDDDYLHQSYCLGTASEGKRRYTTRAKFDCNWVIVNYTDVDGGRQQAVMYRDSWSYDAFPKCSFTPPSTKCKEDEEAQKEVDEFLSKWAKTGQSYNCDYNPENKREVIVDRISQGTVLATMLISTVITLAGLSIIFILIVYPILYALCTANCCTPPKSKEEIAGEEEVRLAKELEEKEVAAAAGDTKTEPVHKKSTYECLYLCFTGYVYRILAMACGVIFFIIGAILLIAFGIATARPYFEYIDYRTPTQCNVWKVTNTTMERCTGERNDNPKDSGGGRYSSKTFYTNYPCVKVEVRYSDLKDRQQEAVIFDDMLTMLDGKGCSYRPSCKEHASSMRLDADDYMRKWPTTNPFGELINYGCYFNPEKPDQVLRVIISKSTVDHSMSWSAVGAILGLLLFVPAAVLCIFRKKVDERRKRFSEKLKSSDKDGEGASNPSPPPPPPPPPQQQQQHQLTWEERMDKEKEKDANVENEKIEAEELNAAQNLSSNDKTREEVVGGDDWKKLAEKGAEDAKEKEAVDD